MNEDERCFIYCHAPSACQPRLTLVAQLVSSGMSTRLMILQEHQEFVLICPDLPLLNTALLYPDEAPHLNNSNKINLQKIIQT